MFRSGRYWTMFLLHSITVSTAFLFAWWLSFNFRFPRPGLFFVSAAGLVAIRWIAINRHKLAHGHWLYTAIEDLKDLLWAIAVGSVLFFTALRTIGRATSVPISAFVMEGTFTFLLITALGIVARRMFKADGEARSGEGSPVLIVGAGSAAEQLLRALIGTGFRAVGLVDDDPSKQKLKLVGVPVVGQIEDLPALARRYEAAEVLIAIPSATVAELIRITDLCTQAGLPYRAVPSLSDLIDGKVTISEFRAINVDDLLGREPVQLESDGVRAYLKGRVVMVTGAAGSIGSELCKQIVRYQPKKLICVDQAETPLFNLQQHTLAAADVEVIYSVANFTNTERVRQLLIEHEVMVIFHAAAFKHVPMTEMNPHEGLQNNVFGLRDLVETAEECGCEDFLLISTDKAVNPSSLMGCTKRIGEMIVGSREPGQMRCVAVRFGNVLGSQGSVIPLFQEQIRTRRCVTVTHPHMTRYFMTIPEAVALLLQAFTVGEHGNILVLDMGEPIRIVDLAKSLIRISGNRESDIRIVYTGMRPGEKLHEELFYESEIRLQTSRAKVMQARGYLPDREDLGRQLHELQLLPYYQGVGVLRAKIKQIVPEYQWEPDEELVFAAPNGSGLVPVESSLQTYQRSA